MFGIGELTKLCRQLRTEMTAGFARLEGKLNQMPTRQEFDDAKAALGQAINDAATRIATDIQALRDQIAGNPITDQDLADIQTDLAKVGSLDPAVVPPPPAARR
jgi:hypothetical protein